MRSQLRVLAGAAALSAALLAPAVLGSAHAQAQVRVQTSIARDKVEVGQPFEVSITALGDGASSPQHPQFSVPSAFEIRGPHTSARNEIQLRNGRISSLRGIAATWVLTPKAKGSYNLGPGTVMVGGKRVSGRKVRVEVVAKGTLPRRRRQRIDPRDPFSLLRGFPGFDFDDDFDDPFEELLQPAPPEFRVDRASDALAFLRATSTPERVVVGEQVRFRVYAYGARGPFNVAIPKSPRVPDFLSFPLVEDQMGEPTHRLRINDSIWHARKTYDALLFPIRAGQLKVGGVEMVFNGPRYWGRRGRGKGIERVSPEMLVTVVEPPAQGRPPGYQIGDVGEYRLSARVEPRKLTQGESISVVLKLEGTGNLPHTVSLPQQKGIEWLDPSVVDDVEPQGDSLAGWRKFTFIGRVDKSGQVDLGEVRLPYWNPRWDRYETAKTRLGMVTVSPSPRGTNGAQSPTADEPSAEDKALDMSARPQLGPKPRQPWLLTEHWWFWLALAAGPLGVLVIDQAARAGGRLRQRRRDKKVSSQHQALVALKEARSQAKTDIGAASSSIERAVVQALEASTGVKARGVLRDELVSKLEAAGLDPELAEQARRILDRCDDLRFAGSSEGATSSLIDEAGTLVKALLKRAGRSGGKERA